MGLLLRGKLLRRVSKGALFSFSLTLSGITVAAPPCADWMGKIIAVQGTLEKSLPQQSWTSLAPEQYLCPGDTLRTGQDSRASIYLRNNTYMRLSQNAIIRFPVNGEKESFWVQLKLGVAHFLSRIVNRFEVDTPYVNAMVEGTEFVVEATESGSVTVIEGKVLAFTDTESLRLTQGEQALSEADKRLRSLEVNTQDTVAWAIYYPPGAVLTELAAISDSLVATTLTQAQEMTERHRPDAALQTLRAGADDEPSIKLARAAILLTSGQQQEAGSLLESLQNDQRLGHLALAMKAVLAAVNSQSQQALQLAQDAVALNADSPSALLALSYAWQANINLPEAIAAAERATVAAPHNVIVWTRLAELQLTSGAYSNAKYAASRATEIAPTHPQAQIAEGFIALFEHKLADADAHFQRAIKADPGVPDAWLGLGLTKLRGGDLEAGRNNLEVAVSLSPNNAVLRSYLGRAYFEEKRSDDAGEQWLLAKERDSKDPTPYFYDGVNKLFSNDPVGAIEELEQSKQLNRNRAVYRSDGLLQSDSAARSAALARAYGEAGFDQAVLLEGWEALRQDPTSADGHRLLADRYLSQPNHQAARVSELMQAQLWQPVTAYPLQPQLYETGLPIVEGLGPSRSGVNEYHPLFLQDGVYGLSNGFVGSDDTWGEDIVVSGLQGPVSASLGQYHYESDGFRNGQDQDQEQNIYNGFLQWQVHPSISIQLEARKAEKDDHLFKLKTIAPDTDPESRSVDTKTYRVGLASRLDNHNSWLFSAIRQKFEEEQALAAADTVSDRKPRTYEVQYIHTASNFYAQTGAGRASIETKTNIQNPAGYINNDDDITHRNIYTYFGIQPTESIFLLVGAAYDNLQLERTSNTFIDFPFPLPDIDLSDSATDEIKQWSPKFGVEFTPTEQLTLRLATFRSLKRDIAADRTIEPAQILGFNQLYDDPNGSDVKTYAAAVDYKLGSRIGGGLEAMRRTVDIRPRLLQKEPERPHHEFENYKLYYFGVLSPSATVDIAYEYEDQDLEDSQFGTGSIYRAKTHSLPLGVTLYLPRHLSMRMESIYTDQTIKASFASDDQRDFNVNLWTFNVRLDYKLPRRFGELQFGVDNLFDNNKEILNSELDYPRYYPKRFLYSRIQLSF
ncbi:FOG: TPR repeat [Hahella chejuensis KCTC 2396]|uniref:FOG: TPR repeat n=1 Tax=Hahella chejuensis (strain KCTC 2396) TaxID=349521 RepID=Q2SDD3_HAHCH|nr:FecR domain-containing protein [Hahella chejuensis]ABC31341.1 FOG: TPR repeat [Hahella chejuensis KCTC 2396]